MDKLEILEAKLRALTEWRLMSIQIMSHIKLINNTDLIKDIKNTNIINLILDMLNQGSLFLNFLYQVRLEDEKQCLRFPTQSNPNASPLATA